MKVKICGLTNPANAKQVAGSGIDAIGLVFYEKSSRFVNIQQAQEIINNLPPFINRVGLFVNQSQAFIEKILSEVAIDTLQFHGTEVRADCEKYGLPYIKSVAIDKNTNLEIIAKNYYNASGLLLDTPSVNFGGTGKKFDWSLITKIDMPVILAGGLNAQNIADAILQVKPFAVDISSGVESSKGIKDIQQVKEFIKNCQ